MSDGMPEIQHFSQPRFEFVFLHHRRFEPHGTRDEPGELTDVGLPDPGALLSIRRKNGASRPDGDLCNFRQAVPEFLLRQRRQNGRVDERRPEVGEMPRSGSCRPDGRSPTFPPTLLSTWASRVVGTCTNPIPRNTVAATYPAMSPTTPPPSAIIRLSRFTSPAKQLRSGEDTRYRQFLECSPRG